MENKQESELDDELFNRFLVVREQELLTHQKELEYKQAQNQTLAQEIQLNFELAQKSIESKERIESKRLDTLKSLHHSWVGIWLFISLLLSAIIISALLLGQAEIALRIAEIIGATVMGYALGRYRQASQTSDKNED